MYADHPILVIARPPVLPASRSREKSLASALSRADLNFRTLLDSSLSGSGVNTFFRRSIFAAGLVFHLDVFGSGCSFQACCSFFVFLQPKPFECAVASIFFFASNTGMPGNRVCTHKINRAISAWRG